MDSDGNEAMKWEEMAEQVEAFFRNNLGGTTDTPLSSEGYQNQILGMLIDKLYEEEKLSRKALLTMQELELAVRAMKTHRCPGLDGVPIEFFQTL